LSTNKRSIINEKIILQTKNPSALSMDFTIAVG